MFVKFVSLLHNPQTIQLYEVRPYNEQRQNCASQTLAKYNKKAA